MSAYRQAIHATTETITRRAQYFRNLVIAVVLLGIASLGAALWLRALAPLAGFLFLVPLCGLFFCLDARLVGRWRSGLLEAWERSEIDFSALREALRVTPTLPKETLAAMVNGLPASGTPETEHAVPRKSREAVAAGVRAIHAYRGDVLVLKTAASAIVALSLVLTIVLEVWHPLICAGIALLLPVSACQARRARLRAATAAALATGLDPDFSYAEFRRFTLELDWQPISPAEKERFVALERPVRRE